MFFKGPFTNWTTVSKVHEAKTLLLENTILFYGTPKQDMVRRSTVSVIPDGGAIVDDNGITIESNCTLTNLVEDLRKAYISQEGTKKAFVSKLARIIEGIGSTQLRNAMSFGDALYVSAEVKAIMKTLVSEVKGVMSSVMTSVRIPWLEENEEFRFEKVSKRRGNLQPSLCVAVKIRMKNFNVSESKVFIANEMGTEMETKSIEAAINGSKFGESIFIPLNNLYSTKDDNLLRGVLKKIMSGHENEREDEMYEISSTQFEEFVYGLPSDDIEPFGKPFPIKAGLLCATGEAVFVDDMPQYSNELFIEFVTSSEAHARIKQVDASKALAMEGVDRKSVV